MEFGASGLKGFAEFNRLALNRSEINSLEDLFAEACQDSGKSPDHSHMRSEQCPNIGYDVVIRPTTFDLIRCEPGDGSKGTHHAWHGHKLVQ